MGKEISIILSILIIVIIGDIFTQKYTKKTVDIMNQEIEVLVEVLLSEDASKEDMQSKSNNIIELWDERFKVLAYYIEHDELEKVKTELVVLSANIEVEEYEKGLEELEKCKYILEHIQEKEEFSLANIF